MTSVYKIKKSMLCMSVCCSDCTKTLDWLQNLSGAMMAQRYVFSAFGSVWMWISVFFLCPYFFVCPCKPKRGQCHFTFVTNTLIKDGKKTTICYMKKTVTWWCPEHRMHTPPVFVDVWASQFCVLVSGLAACAGRVCETIVLSCINKIKSLGRDYKHSLNTEHGRVHCA